MYMPNLIPRDVHHLWLRTDKPPHTQQPPNSHDENENENYNYNYHSPATANAPPLASYSSERPGPILANADEKLCQLKAIRTLGYSYLMPLGVGKTMQTLFEENEMKRQMEEQYTSEAVTAENMMGEAEQAQMAQNMEQQQQQQQIPPPQVQATPVQLPQAPVQQTPHDLDEEIPEAEEADYGAYDDDIDEDASVGTTLERQYDRGFMVTEQFEDEQDIGEERIPPPPQSPVQFTTPARDINTGRRHLAHSGSMGSIATTGTNWESSFEGNISMNASDLDMTIDD